MSTDMFPDGFIEHMLEQEKVMASSDKDHCGICGKEIKVSIFRGTGWCSEEHRKELAGETGRPSAQTDAGITNLLRQPTGEVNLRGIK